MNNILNFFNRTLKRIGVSVLVNGNATIEGIFKEIDDKTNGRDSKYFITLGALNQGDYITYKDTTYIVLTKNEQINNAYNLFTIMKCPYKINYTTDLDTYIHPYFSIIETQTLGFSSGQIVEVDGKITAITQSNNITNKISINHTFIKMGRLWKVQGVDSSIEGILKFDCGAEEFNSGDDKVNEIPVGYKDPNSHSYNLSVSPTNISINKGSTQQITATVTDNGETINNPTLLYTSDNTSIATVSNTGIVTAIADGTCNITVTFTSQDNKVYTQTISTTIIIPATSEIKVMNVTSNVDVTTAASVKIRQGDNTTFTVNKYVNNVANTDGFTFTVSGVPSDYYTFNVIDDNHFNVINNKKYTGAYLTVHCVDKISNEFIDIKILLSGVL